MELVNKALSDQLLWPRFDKHWPFLRGQILHKKVAFAATNYSPGLFEMGYQGEKSFRYFNFPLSPAIQVSQPEKQAAFLAGRLCAHQLLFDFAVHHDYLESDVQSRPIWPKSVVGAIAHSYPYSLAVLANAKDYLSIGLAIKGVIRADLKSHLEQGILSEEEKRVVGYSIETLTLIYCVKSSFIHALSPLIKGNVYFDDVKVVEIDWQNGEAKLELNRDLTNLWAKGERLEAQFDYYQAKLISMIVVPKPANLHSLFN